MERFYGWQPQLFQIYEETAVVNLELRLRQHQCQLKTVVLSIFQ